MRMGPRDQSPPAPGAPRPGTVTVRLAEDRMTAYLIVEGPEPGGAPVTVEQAMEKLREAGVCFGLDPAAVERAVAAQGERPITAVVARGKPPVHGTDGRLELHPELLRVSGRPRVNPDGSVDLYDLGLVRSVAAGTVLLTRIPPTPGTPGINVLGQEVRPRPGREPVVRLGKGVAWTPDGRQAVAQVDGHASWVRETLSVTPVFTVREDVGPSTGNIEFIGSVVVRGNVLPGFQVKAGGSVEIQGAVDCGVVEAGGDLMVRFGIQGGGRGRVRAGGNIRARFIENCEVSAGGHIWVQDGILHSRVEAGGRVEALGRRGTVAGGRVLAGEAVIARFLGSPMGTPTEVTVGVQPQTRRELEALRRELQEVEQQLGRALQTLALLRQPERLSGLSPERVDALRRLAEAPAWLTAKRDELAARIQELEEALSGVRQAWVEAQTLCYPGVRVVIGGAVYVATDNLSRVRFTVNEDREVVIGPV